MIDWAHALDAVWSGLLATSPLEATAVALGLAYAVFAVRKSRWCWVTGGLSSAIMIYLAVRARLPMQAALQVYYVVISVYGWWHWTASGDSGHAAGHHMAATPAPAGMRRRRPGQCAHGSLAGRPDPGRVALSRLAHHLGSLLRDVAASPRQARELALLDLHRLGSELPICQPGALLHCAIVCDLPRRFCRRIHEMAEDLSDPYTRELTLAEAVAHVPGYRPGDPSIQMSRLSGGSVNRSYEVSTPVGRFVVRLSQGPTPGSRADRSVEREIASDCVRSGIAPHIVHANERWLVTEYVDGQLWTEPDFGNPERLAQLGDTLRRLHDLQPPGCGRFDLLRALAGYAKRVGAEPDSGAGDLAGYLESAAMAWTFCGAAERPLAILHHDLHSSNLIDSARGVVLIDWECAAVSDPLLDVACILSYHESARRMRPCSCGAPGWSESLRASWRRPFGCSTLHTYLWYRERRMRISPTEAERQAEHHLSVRLPRTLENWRSGNRLEA